MVDQGSSRHQTTDSGPDDGDRWQFGSDGAIDDLAVSFHLDPLLVRLDRSIAHRAQDVLFRLKRAIKLAKAPQDPAVAARVSGVERVAVIQVHSEM